MSFPKLDLSHDLQTRLLRILPGDDADPLQCRFSAVSLSDDHRYFALSYAWGAPTPNGGCSMQCGEQNLSISPTINDFLRIYRKKKEDIHLWIDALCIDQENDVEKSYQIPNMRFVYSKAAMVIVWLDASDKDTVDVFNLLAELKRANDCLEKHGLKPDRSICLNSMKEGSIPSFDKPVWKALDDFYRRPWFKRLWVLQEIILAQNKIYMCGQHFFEPDFVEAGVLWIQYYQLDVFVPIGSETGAAATKESIVRIDWNEVKAYFAEAPQHDETIGSTECDPMNISQSPQSDVQEAHEIHPAEPKILPGVDLSTRVYIDPAVARSIAPVRIRSLSGTSIPLLHLLRATRTRQTSVTKDRIFALLGIADEANEGKHGENALKLNYAHNKYATFVFTTRFLINHHKSLEVLKMVEYLPGFENEIFTWVPRWDSPQFVRGNILSEPDDQTGFAASANLPLRIEDDDDAIFSYCGQKFPSVLAVHGQRFDRIVYASRIISWHDLVYGDQFHSTRIYDLYEEFKKNVQSRFGIAAYPSGEDFRTVFVMTAVAGLDEHGHPADAEAFVKHFLHQYGNELEDDIPDKPLARRFRMTAGHGDLEMFRLLEEIRGGSRIRFLAAFKRAAEHRRLFLTAKGYVGLGPAAMNVNDHICILFGANVPYVYRNPSQKGLYEQGYLGPLSGQQMREDIFGLLYDDQAPYAAEFRSHSDFYLGQEKVDGSWDMTWLQNRETRTLIGHCYVHGAMHGEAVREFQEGKRESVLFKFR